MAKQDKKNNILIFKTFSIKQFIWFILGIIVFGTGVGLLITYYVGEALPTRSPSYNSFLNALNAFNSFTHTSFGFIGWGIILLLLGAIIIAVVLSLSSKVEDKERERQARKELRLQALRAENKQDNLIEDVISTLSEDK
ncbi:MAG: hypothetical protein SOV26_03150 [Candidatus Onthovivens sp.]|nr:hypothetical protein [Candidatus Onthovivens sp.]